MDETKKARRSVLTVAESKNGAVLVINKFDCEKLGIPSSTTTKEALKMIRIKLGLKKEDKGIDDGAEKKTTEHL